MSAQIDTCTVRHLDAWLSSAVSGDTRREKVRAVMLDFIADDPEYWGSQSWWSVFDHAKCDRILED